MKLRVTRTSGYFSWYKPCEGAYLSNLPKLRTEVRTLTHLELIRSG